MAVGHLNADHGNFVRNGGDAHARGPQRQRDVIRQIGDFGKLDPLIQHKFVPGDGGAVDHLARRGLHAEALQRLAKAAGVVPQLGSRLRKVAAAVFIQQRDGRELIGPFPGGQGVLDLGRDLGGGGGHLLGGGAGFFSRGHGRGGRNRSGRGRKDRRHSGRSHRFRQGNRLRYRHGDWSRDLHRLGLRLGGLCRLLRQKLVGSELLIGFLAEKAVEQAGLFLRRGPLFAIQRNVDCAARSASLPRPFGGNGRDRPGRRLRLRLVPEAAAALFHQALGCDAQGGHQHDKEAHRKHYNRCRS
ncbi:hypothetical protein SDC9_120343 [bioreactor metagenome]|uniref:Uncharacterized protein n=1 Tax=bioreactor metagenome TaxID=1076179 RepID=A0A645C983_9ZZZZ